MEFTESVSNSDIEEEAAFPLKYDFIDVYSNGGSIIEHSKVFRKSNL